MADALASGASGSNTVWVQVPSPAFRKKRGSSVELPFFLKKIVPNGNHS